MNREEGIVFNIQHFSIQDGTGIRTTVFLKGCPLSCIWCANPESQNPERELFYCGSRCIHCGSCRMADTDHIVSCREDGFIEIHPEEGKHPETYEDVCPAQALTVVGEKKSVREILDVVEQDAVFYRNSYGGITLSGGEPLMQPDFSETLLKEAGKRHIHRAIETTGFAAYPNLERVFENLDLILYDIKLLDEEKHRRFTGVSNKIILENFDRMRRQFPQKPVCVRTPVIPGVNDTVQEISAIRDFVKQYPNTSYELLKYHRLGESKYHSLGREWRMGDAELSEETWQRLQELL